MDINYQDLIGHIFDGLYLVDKKRTIIYWNRSAERITGYTMDDVAGRACYENILVHVDTMGTGLCRRLCPLAATIKDGKPRDAELYLRHKDGHRVPVWVRTAQLKDSKGQVVGGAELFSDLSANNAIANKIEELERHRNRNRIAHLHAFHILQCLKFNARRQPVACHSQVSHRFDFDPDFDLDAFDRTRVLPLEVL